MRELNVDSRPFVRGMQIGCLCKDVIHRNIARYRDELDRVKKNHAEFLGELYSRLYKMHSVAIQELLGMANGSQTVFMDIFLLNYPEMWGGESGCTTVAIRNQSGAFIVHNEDEENWRRPDDYVLVRAMGEDGRPIFSAICTPPELPGNAASWNKNFFFSVDCMTPFPKRTLNDKNTPRFFEARKLLEQSSLEDALVVLDSDASASAFHYLFGEFGSGVIFSVEKFYEEMSVYAVEDFFYHTNHPTHKAFSQLDRARFSPNSVARMMTVKAKIKKSMRLPEVVSAMLHHLRRPIDGNDSSQTFATIFADLKSRKVSLVDEF